MRDLADRVRFGFPRARCVLVVAACCVVLGCDALLVEPSTHDSVQLTFDPGRVGVGLNGRPPWGVRELWLRLTTDAVSRDTIVPAIFEGGRLLAAVRLRPEESARPLQVDAELRLPHGLAMLGGSATVDPSSGMHIELAPRPVIAALVWGKEAVAFARPDGSQRTEHEIVRPFAIDISPVDGSVVVQGEVGRAEGIYEVDPYTGEVRRLVESEVDGVPAFQFAPLFSPDGRWIYFVDAVGGGIWRVTSDGSEAEEVLATGDHPSPAPDGQRLLYWEPTEYSGELRMLNLASKVSHPVVATEHTRARWSPDGEWIAYAPNGRLRIVRPDGSDDRSLTPTLSLLSFDWTGDPAYIIAATDAHVAVRIEVSTGAIEVLPGLGPVHAVAAVGLE